MGILLWRKNLTELHIISETKQYALHLLLVNAYSPEDLFCCEFGPYFMEGIKIRYPEYCRELPPARKQEAPAR